MIYKKRNIKDMDLAKAKNDVNNSRVFININKFQYIYFEAIAW